jgi:hypothetical protein
MKVRINRQQLADGERLMSRADKRAIAKRYGLSMHDVERIFKDATIKNVYETFIEGSQVKLNYDRIMENTEGKSELYLQFVEEHKDDIMTIEYDENHKDSPTIFCLKEDTNPVKWLFDISDLILVEMATPIEPVPDTVSAYI